MTKDLTRGTPWKLILQFALPIMAGNLLQQLYNTADTIIVGNFNGQQALSAVPGVKEAKVDLESKSATVSVDGNVTDAVLKAAVDEAGYQAVSIR